MAFKINISESGKTFHMELESEELIRKKIGDKIKGNEVLPDLHDYELEITGTSDEAGFPGKADEKGPQLRKILLTKGKFLHKTPHKGFRRKKSVRGNEISAKTKQINIKVVKQGAKKLHDIFPEQSKKKEEKTE